MSIVTFIKLAITFGPELRQVIAELIQLWRSKGVDETLKGRRARELHDRIEFLARQRL